jgi:ketosteroid isomerase-like protein
VSEQNVAVVRDIFDAWGRGESFAHADAYAPDVEFEMVGEFFPDPGTYRGPEAMAKGWIAWLAAWEDFHTTEPEIVDQGDRVICFYDVQGRGRTSGIDVEASVAAVFTFREGKIVQLRLLTREQALMEAGIGAPPG